MGWLDIAATQHRVGSCTAQVIHRLLLKYNLVANNNTKFVHKWDENGKYKQYTYHWESVCNLQKF